MYQNIFYQFKRRRIHIWDDNTGYSVHPFSQYAYVKDGKGTHTSLYGDKLRKLPISRIDETDTCLLYTSPSPRDDATSRMPSSA